MSEQYFRRFSGDTDPLSDKMFQRTDPNLFRFLVTGRFPAEPIPETNEERDARLNSTYTPEERKYLLTDERRELIASTGPEGQCLLAFMESGDPVDLGQEIIELLARYDSLHPTETRYA
jgi:hypothetical protein